jgi:hypothetical protein
MANFNTLREYLVSLGFAIDAAALRRFDDTLKRVGTAVAKVAGTMEMDFVVAGGAVVSALAAVTAGTVSMMNRVAQNDLQFDLFARRMYMGVDAAKKLKIATDALGYSLEDIVWGPPELAERYTKFVKAQDEMLKNLGGPAFERSMRNLRDIRAEFSLFGVEVQYLGMQLTKSIMDKLSGGPDALDRKLEDLNKRFRAAIPWLADQLSGVLAPLLSRLGELADKVFTKKNAEWTVSILTKGAEGLGMTYDYLTGKGGKDPTAGLGGLWDKSKTFNENMNTLVPGILGMPSENESADPVGAIRKEAAKYSKQGITAAMLLAIAARESGINPTAPRGKAGEVGMMQVMPATGAAEGFSNLFDLTQNIDAGAVRLAEGIRRFGVSPKAFGYYNGSGAAADAYGLDVWKRYQDMQKTYPESGASAKPMGYNVDVGGIHITQPGATPEQIKLAVTEALDAAHRRAAARAFAHAQGSYA